MYRTGSRVLVGVGSRVILRAYSRVMLGVGSRVLQSTGSRCLYFVAEVRTELDPKFGKELVLL